MVSILIKNDYFVGKSTEVASLVRWCFKSNQNLYILLHDLQSSDQSIIR